ncbi:hypothetical protein VOLCADRAFT_121415 [Volvox carteri f. nagariensis]|uniref:Uncharacterized protein n=1 Tax=Volvox carteri f. nagariensis TaxID=3068 RepID=D8U9M4_VOLCA|nr:uncharacterized protein VOLCADRAFT_121415 [Volvox carteri f. nagariensis]EFJ43608.1 hypothetical protein VOLCADRAFT_121415 [Volvox carteri f. nagariensis]|eukprot:XP_002955308.1 hypothetical protein VOLCADRAFT_121415 [Volvox carteri f. nagariensis]
MPIADFVKEIDAKKLKAVQERLKKEKASQKYTPDAKKPGVFHYLLHHAVKGGDPAIVEALLAAAADVSALDHEDSTALHWAVRDVGTPPKIAELLLEKKAKVDALNKAKMTPLHVAAVAGALSAIDLLVKAGAAADVSPPGGGGTPLQCALRACCEGALKPAVLLEVVDKLVAAGAKLTTKDANGLTPLMFLVESGRVAEALQLLERPNCGVDELDPSGRSLLMVQVASDQPHMDLVRELVAKGASADLQYPQSLDTPLHVAALKGNLALVTALLPAATAAEVALAEASGGAGAAIAEAIVTAGGDPGEAGMSLMKAAVEKKADGIAALLVPLLKPAVLTSLDLEFKTFIAAGLGRAAMAYVKRFDAEHAGDAPVDDAGNTYLHLVAESGGSYDVVTAMMSLGLNPNTANKEGDSPLHVAARGGHVEVCRALVDGGADVLKRNNKNRTPRSQLKLPDNTKDYLAEAEESFKAAKDAKKGALWDDKMKATQTESAFGLRVM